MESAIDLSQPDIALLLQEARRLAGLSQLQAHEAAALHEYSGDWNNSPGWPAWDNWSNH